MAILCGAAKNSLRGTTVYSSFNLYSTLDGVWCSADATAVSRWATPLHQQFCHLFAYSLFSPLCTFVGGTKIQNGIVESFKLAYFYIAAL
jgi:hypothetical protein